MNDEQLTKLRDELAEERADGIWKADATNHPFTVCDFKNGFDAAVKLMRDEIAELKSLAYAKCVKCEFVLATNGVCLSCENAKLRPALADYREALEFVHSWLDDDSKIKRNIAEVLAKHKDVKSE